MATGSSEENLPPTKTKDFLVFEKEGDNIGEICCCRRKELEEASKGVVPLNTKKNNTWAVQNFNEWWALSHNS